MKTAFPRILPALLVLAILALALGGIVDHDLWTPDEPRVCCISKTMWQTRDWAVPRLAGEIFLEKPPLYFWLCGACGNLFGSLFGYVGAARLSCSLCTLGTLAAAAWLAYLLRGRRRDALFAVLVLATMPQFILEMRWMRTDVLLAFFVVVAVAFLVLAYRHGRPWALLPAGLAAAGAFLSKGPIGWILIAPAALPLALHAFLSERGHPARGRWLLAHLLAAFFALGFSALWVLAIYRHPDPAAWKAWFWENQIGRTTGTATALGHHNPWALHYYFVLLPVVLGPWWPHLVHALVLRVRKFRGIPWKTLLASPAFLLVCWGFGGLLLLTIPSTKRGIYLLPLYPAFALMAAAAIPRAANRFYRVWATGWEVASAVVAVGILLLPLTARLFPGDFTVSPSAAVLLRWTPYHTATLLFAILCIPVWRTLRGPAPGNESGEHLALRLFLSNAFLWLVLFGVPFQAIDAGKSMREATLRFAAELPDDISRTASVRLDETARAALEYYAGVVLAPSGIPLDAPPQEASKYVDGILAGKNPDVSFVVVEARHDRDKFWPPEVEAAHGRLGGKRHVYLLSPVPREAGEAEEGETGEETGEPPNPVEP